MVESIYNDSYQTASAVIFFVIKQIFTPIIYNQTAGYREKSR